MGGLSCGVILAKNGYDITVLEQGMQAGGCLQCFSRGGVRFETGMHFIGSAREGQTLDRLLHYLEIRKDIRLSELDRDGYDVICLDGKRYRFANGREAFIEQLSSYFPHQHQQLNQYFDLIEKVAGASSLHSLKYAENDTAVNTEYQLRSINEVIDSIITDPLLAKILVGSLPLYAAERDKTPFSTHAYIMDFYNQSAFRIVGGSDMIGKSMVNTIEKYGGRVLTRQRVTKIVCDETHATGVEINGSDFLSCDIVISDAHPKRTLELIDSRLIRPAFRSRIGSMPQTVGGFSVYIEFQDNAMPYQNYNFYGYNTGTPWDCETYDELSWPKGYLYMHFCQEPNPRYAKTGVILSYMQMKDVEQWHGTSVGHRGADYEAFKQQKADKLITSVEHCFPGLRSKIKRIYTSTPLTYLDYTGTEGGGMYGIARDIRLGAACRVPHRTKIPNVLQTGQNINSHGILGVIVGTIVTCSELLTAERIYQQIMSQTSSLKSQISNLKPQTSNLK
jgi:all-trans-retinol 13,14-reductase